MTNEINHVNFSGSCASGEKCQYSELIDQLQKENLVLKEQAHTDALTGLFNYRFFKDSLNREMERAQRSLQPMSMIMIDIDYFKKLNDQWGHEIGNHALAHLAVIIYRAIRKLDIACRYGGEEFVVLLPNTDLRQAVYVAKRIRELIADSPLKVEDHVISITASLGVDEYRANQTDSSEGFIQRVDEWLYKAKQNGRNQVMHPDLVEDFSKTANVTMDEKTALFDAFASDQNSAQ